MINLLSKTFDFIKNNKFANKTWKGVKSEKMKVFPLVCSKYLSSWTGLGRSGHVQITTSGPISQVSGPEMVFWQNFIMILHHFCWRSSKIKVFSQRNSIFNKNQKNIQNKSRKICKNKSCPYLLKFFVKGVVDLFRPRHLILLHR